MLGEPEIPGQTPLTDLSGLRDASIRTIAVLNAREAENIRRVAVRYLVARPSRRLAPFDAAWFRVLHREMFGDVWSWAGEFRRHETNIGSPPHRVSVDLHELVADLHAWVESGMPVPEQATRLHHRAVQIHPFPNGNGRWSRMLASVWLRRHGLGVVMWPESAIGGVSPVRAEYLEALRAADRGDIGALQSMHVRFLEDVPSSRSPRPPQSRPDGTPGR